MKHVLLVTGSRSWRYVDVINIHIDGLVAQGWTGDLAALVNGCAEGADQQARTKALTCGWTPIDLYPRDYMNMATSYGHACVIRDQAMVDQLKYMRSVGLDTRSVAFWRKHSRGTGHTIDFLRDAGFEPAIYYDCPCHALRA